MFLHQAAEAVSRNSSARAIAGHTHCGGDLTFSAADEREEHRRTQWREVSLRDERARDEREQWVRVYIEYTALHGPDNLYLDAIKYLAELDQADEPPSESFHGLSVRGSGPSSLLTAQDRAKLIEFIGSR